ncbi:hypothetical protein BH11MYX1_BH11MYX1_08460 [soil metagenome]
MSDGWARFTRRDGALHTSLAIAVDNERDAELRRVTIENRGQTVRTITLTSYAELVLGAAATDASHQSFSKLFVQTEVIDAEGILIATRRRQSPAEPEVWAAHVAVVSGQPAHRLELETSRATFRGRTLRDAVAMEGGVLSNTVGTVLDPIFSLRERVQIAPGASACVAFWTVVAPSRAEVLALARDVRGAELERTIAEAAKRGVTLRTKLGIDAEEAERTTALVGPLLYADASWRAPPEVLARASGGAPVLWARGISGDRPIVLLRLADRKGLERVDELFRAQVWWRTSRLGVDIVLLDTATDDALHAALELAFHGHNARLEADHTGAAAAVFLLRDDQIEDALRDGVATAARIVLDAAMPSEPRGAGATPPPALRPATPGTTVARRPRALAPLELANGTGGFDAREREYVITRLECDYSPPSRGWPRSIPEPLIRDTRALTSKFDTPLAS